MPRLHSERSRSYPGEICPACGRTLRKPCGETCRVTGHKSVDVIVGKNVFIMQSRRLTTGNEPQRGSSHSAEGPNMKKVSGSVCSDRH